MIPVSIHAPTRGATKLAEIALVRDKVSIHAPTRGATNFRCAFWVEDMFQSTHPRGVRRAARSRCACGLCTCFNPRTHAGCDSYEDWQEAIWGVSIHAPTRGATLLTRRQTPRKREFQSTHPRGVRHNRGQLIQPRGGVSIHAPTRGATKSEWTKSRNSIVSIHAPTRGATTQR